MTKTATPWGKAALVEELTVPQRAGQRRFASTVQLLETDGGERLVRFAYSTGGNARRGPVTLRAKDVSALRAALEDHPALRDALVFCPADTLRPRTADPPRMLGPPSPRRRIRDRDRVKPRSGGRRAR